MNKLFKLLLKFLHTCVIEAEQYTKTIDKLEE